MDSRRLRRNFAAGLLAGLRVVWPILSVLLVLIIALGLVVGILEGWSMHESIYFAFVSGLTIGYGDLAPKLLITRALAIVIGLALAIPLIWYMLHQPHSFFIGSTHLVNIVYPVLPWIGLMALGYTSGTLYKNDVPAERRRRGLFAGRYIQGAQRGFEISSTGRDGPRHAGMGKDASTRS